MTMTHRNCRIESVLNVNEDIGDAMLTVSLHDENGDPVVSGKQVQVGYRTTETTGEDRAVAGLDFTAPADGATLTIPPGNESGTFTVAIIDDTLYEIDELFIVQLLNPVNSTLVALPVYVLIFNNDPRPILSVSVAPLNEGDGAAGFTFSLDAVSGLDVVIRYQLKDGTAVAMATPPVPSDYSNMSASYEITIPAGESSVTVEVEVFDDTSDEENETFTLKSSDSETAVWDSTSGSATATIADNDDPPELRISDVSVGEEAGPATFTVDLFDVHDAPVVSGKTVSVGYSTSDGTAVAGDDYTAVSGAVLTIAPGDLSDSFDIDVLDETIDEHDETFTVALSARSGGNATVSTDEGSAVGTIEDDDAEPELRINGNAAAVVESGSSMATFTVSLFDVNDAPVVSGKEIAVELSTLELSDTRLENELFSTLDGRSAREHKAVSNVDFVAIDGEILTIDPGNATKDFVVEILADDLDEFDEVFSVMLANAVNGALHSSTQGNVFGAITDDDDEPELVVDVAASIVESSGPVSFALSLSAFSGRTVVVDYATDNMTDEELETVTGFSGTKASEHGAVAGEDYTHTDGTLEFAPAAGPMTIEVLLSLDEFDEYDEWFALRFTPTHATVDGDAYGVIEDDDDLPTLTMGALEFDPIAVESAAEITYSGELSAASGRSVSVRFVNQTVVATRGEDFEAVDERWVIEPGNISGSFTFGITDDSDLEQGEFFAVVLSEPENVVLLDDMGAPVAQPDGSLRLLGIIFDDDGDALLSIAEVTVTEGAAATLTLELLETPTSTIEVEYSTSDGSAIAGLDYTALVDQVIEFLTGETQKTITVTTIGDTIDEDDEMFSVSFVPTNVVGRAAATATITVVDNNPPPDASFAAPSVVTRREDEATVNLTVVLSSASSRTVEVAYSTVDGTATAGEDYTAVSGEVVTFAPGSTSRTITLEILEDRTAEDQFETFTVELAVLDADKATLGSRSTATVTIEDNEGAPLLEIEDASAGEGSSAVVFEVTLGTASAQAVVVEYSTRDGTASAGSDFVAATGTVTFAAGETTQNLEVELIDDTEEEPTETFEVVLTGATDAIVSRSRGVATGTIRDNDGRRPVISGGGGGGGGGGGSPPEEPVLRFGDVSVDSSHVGAVAALDTADVFARTECGEDLFCPGEPMLRWVMAVWMVRIVDGADPEPEVGSRFGDVDPEVWWAPHVERLAELGITLGCSREPVLYCPDAVATRAQAASFLVRAFGLASALSAGFSDVAGSVHDASIDALHAAGITVGCSRDPLAYCPERATTRAQMATFLNRALQRQTNQPGAG